ncbi:MAG: lipoprotein signal peptidase [Xanthomonadales bacterium]|nr:lipoprotein signal peptidase [Xanthomonadales bacterium]NIN58267.1 lipoprotein signal peptidase [Xanthomonadales bacterium]NIN73612.1 lipoprotein signal peptidase [Xanthomonadales bacterium]NIO14397.1 lipoprotein signal peptidase [Xanthomonadales bacterium]NIP10660.1 lipoprotein signal peptidase [Xanthomonadales bacterium]
MNTAPGTSRRRWIVIAAVLALAALVIVLDWYTKRWASEALILYRASYLLPWLNLTLAHNYGAAFSFLSDAGGWQRWMLTALAVAVTLVLLVWVARLRAGEWRVGLALGLIIGGAVGNLIDRVRLGYVVDFIDVHYRGWHWPAFNVADSAITCGIALLLLDAVLQWWDERQAASGGGP